MSTAIRAALALTLATAGAMSALAQGFPTTLWPAALPPLWPARTLRRNERRSDVPCSEWLDWLSASQHTASGWRKAGQAGGTDHVLEDAEGG
jgi:hypothetical protein